MILVGSTDYVAWGITNPLTDVSDLYYETFNDKGTHYMIDGKWEELRTETHDIKVARG